ncbi:MAG: hypothetical protein AAFQ21_08290 [Pseudomonadota bacterium]
MKKFLMAAATAALIAGAASAATVSVSFANDNGDTQDWTFDNATNTATGPDGVTAPYTWDEAAMTLCADVPEQGELCVVFDEVAQEVGATSTYTVSNGDTGTATVTAMAE